MYRVAISQEAGSYAIACCKERWPALESKKAEQRYQAVLTLLHVCAVSSQHLWFNMPAALALVVSLGWLLQQHEARIKASLSSQAYTRRFSTAAGHKAARQLQPESPRQEPARGHHHSRGSSLGGAAADSKGREDRWRKAVGSDIVAQAWEVLCGSILQEVSCCLAFLRRNCIHRPAGTKLCSCSSYLLPCQPAMITV